MLSICRSTDNAFDLVPFLGSARTRRKRGQSSSHGRRMLARRTTRRCLTTPDRWFPIEFHTQLPFMHWLPKPIFRSMLVNRGLGHRPMRANLNLMTAQRTWGDHRADRRFAFPCCLCVSVGWPAINLVWPASMIRLPAATARAILGSFVFYGQPAIVVVLRCSRS